MFSSSFWWIFQDHVDVQIIPSKSFSPQTDDKSKQTISILEDMLCTFIMDIGGLWEQNLSLVEFDHTNSYHSSIVMAPFNAMYGWYFQYPIGWVDTSNIRPHGTN